MPVRYVEFNSETDEREAIIEYNRQREKTFSQRMAEADELRAIESERQEKERREKIGASRSGETVETLPPSKTRDTVAKQVGIGSGRTYDKANKVWEAAKQQESRGNQYTVKSGGADTSSVSTSKQKRSESTHESYKAAAKATGTNRGRAKMRVTTLTVANRMAGTASAKQRRIVTGA